MSRYQTFQIGRRANNDLVISHESVSRSHAELLLTPDGKAMLSDRCSTKGTFVKDGRGWSRISHKEIGRGSSLKFGNYSIEARKIIDAAEELWREAQGKSSPQPQPEPEPPRPDEPGARRGFVRRNPEDGRITFS